MDISSAAIKTYLQTLQDDLQRGYASEHTHRPAFKRLLESLGEQVAATNEPRQVTACGKPDMVVSRGPVVLGYVETKDINANLDIEEKSPQLQRYRAGLANLLLTNYLEFRWYVNGELRGQALLGRPTPDNTIQSKTTDRQAGQQLLTQFLACQIPDIGTAQDLALRLAGLAHLLREAAVATLHTEAETGTLNGWRAAFEQTLLPNLAAAEFADMYAQTLTYGLFAAKVTVGAGQPLQRDTAAGLLPATNPFLQRLFYHLAGPEVPATVAWAIDDMVTLLNATDWEAVRSDFGRGSLAKDPVVHFYETFLSAYDPERRKIRGVYYTPEPVVSYIVRAVDQIVQQSFGRRQGLADPGTLILDPACGTGTFLYSVIALIYDRLCAQGQAGLWTGEQGYVSVNLLPRLFGFELLMAPYAMAHLKLGLALQERGYTFPPGHRLGVYLTNTLDEARRQSQVLPLAGFITEESNAAAAIKQDVPLEVILGNPHYAGLSANARRRR
ncbi:MAG: N-6 DNA methylase, partial [Desulfobacca sp.]|uniref:N-6 DNA methylase n=1 Tax=Desulfobacca sp. TaxID=2067990 RepID=UPI00404B0854